MCRAKGIIEKFRFIDDAFCFLNLSIDSLIG